MLLSGGIDSAAIAHLLKSRGHPVRGIFVDYGQAAARNEEAAATRFANHIGMTLDKIVVGNRSGFGAGELVGRNAFLIAAAVFLGGIREGLLAIGVHAGTPYYDCTPDFVAHMKSLIEAQSNGTLTLIAPFQTWHKPEILAYFRNAGLPVEAAYSCESGTLPPCGSCASCRDREALGC